MERVIKFVSSGTIFPNLAPLTLIAKSRAPSALLGVLTNRPAV